MLSDGKLRTILIVDDDADDRAMIKEAFEKVEGSFNLKFLEDGEQLMDTLKQGLAEGSLAPSVILLDLNMPRKDGREALREIKESKELRSIPVIIFTTSKSEKDISDSYELGCNCYITKPPTYKGLVEVIRSISVFWFDIVHLQQPV